MLEAALRYKAEYGWNLIPVWWVRKNGMCGCGKSHDGDERSIGKHPCLPTWKEWQTKEVTEDQLKEWWAIWPAASIAMLTGCTSHTAVVDDDDKESQPGRYETLAAHTGSGGRHYFFRVNDPLPSKPRIDDHTDFKADGGYVILPPSSHQSGRHYVWDNSLPMATVPDSVISLLRGTVGTTGGSLRPRNAPHSPGTRNDSMMREVASLFGRGYLPQNVLAKIRQWNEEWNFPPLRDEELVACVRSLWNNQEKDKRLSQQHRRSRVEVPQGELNIRTTEFMFEKYGAKEQTWLIPGWLPTATCGIVGAPPETFKTWFMLDLALSLTSGKPFLGRWPVKKTGRVLIVQQEDNYTAVLDRLARIANLGEPRSAGNGEYLFPFWNVSLPDWAEDRTLHIENEMSMARLRDYIEEFRPLLVLIDPMFSFIPLADDYGTAAAQLINSKIKPLRDAYDTSFIFLHHTKGAAKKLEATGGRQRDSLWGSVFLNAGLETAWHLRCEVEGGKLIAVKRHTKVAGHEPDVQTDWCITDWGCEIR